MMKFTRCNSLNLLILDDNPAKLPVSDSALRLSGLYSNLGQGLQARYAGDAMTLEPGVAESLNGARDWRLPAFLAQSLRKAGIDIHGRIEQTQVDAVKRLMQLSAFCPAEVRAAIARADIIIFSHLLAYWLLADLVDKSRQVVVYDAQYAEDLLRARREDGKEWAAGFAGEIMRTGDVVCRECDWILARSWEQKKLLNKLYEVPYAKMRLAGNGVFIEQIQMPSRSEKRKAKARLRLTDNKIALFFGTLNARNIEAAKYIFFDLAPVCPEICFIICGEVCKGLSMDEFAGTGRMNARIAGPLDEEEKWLYLRAADFALNPVEGVLAANMKMFDYFAAGLPTLATPAGGGNIVAAKMPVYLESKRADFARSLQKLLTDSWRQKTLAENARKLIEEKFAWERLSPALGKLMTRASAVKQNRPFFSVVIPTYERHAHLDSLLRCLEQQENKNFEVIIIDQSSTPWPGDPAAYNLNIFYVHTDIKGAVKARNTGATYATGKVIAFTDDDCQPKSQWLSNAYQYFRQDDVVGVEGFIVSDKRFSSEYRAVTNEGFEGIGFMTANLLIRSEIFHRLNGFDEIFDNPHFREDTDLGWRALEFGRIPFGHDVVVYHPPHKCSNARESKGERDKFFVNDPLLLKKHPQRYKDLFFMEGHYRNPDFRRFFVYGALEHNVEIPDWCLESFKSAGYEGFIDLTL